MCECKIVLLCSIVLCNVFLVTSFNIDQFNYAIFGSETNTMFGFTVAIHKDRSQNSWVLIGAPEDQSRYQPTVKRGGVVYKCRFDADNYCEEVPFDRSGNAAYRSGVDQRDLDDKSSQWFGATLSSSGRPDGPIVACAPRYVWFTKDLTRRDPVGTCYVSNGGFDHFEEYSPCRTSNWGYHRQGSCQAGFSAAINRVGDRLYIGAPGSYYWQGQTYSIDAHAHFNYTPGFFGNAGFGSKGSVHQQSLESREAVFSTREGSVKDDDSYMAYSTVVGHFKQNEKYEGIAVGMPRGNNLKGKVLLFTWNLVNYKNITISKQIGSYFGYSIAAADVNGDGMLDIIVGAPMHTEPNNDMNYDVGRVYVFYQSKDFVESFNNSQSIDGFLSKSRFGHSVSTLGDLNKDGYDDFAIGAPYDGPEGNGAVYIYYGSKKGIRKKYGQVIYAEDVRTGLRTLSTFGFSVTGGMDLDGNEYPDMAVGAYLSDMAFFFRSRPVVLVDAYVKLRTSDVDIKQKNCRLPNGQDGTCTDVDFCIKYTGQGIPAQLQLNLQYVLDSKKPAAPRMAFLTRDTHTFNDTVQLYKDNKEYNCKTEQVYVKNDIRDKLTTLDVEVRYFMEESSSYQTIRDPRSKLKPVLDLNSPPSRKDSMSIRKNCGLDQVCIPDLKVNVFSKIDRYLLGSNGNLEFDVVVSNSGEDSFETTFEMQYPDGIYYRKIITEDNAPGILCSPLENRTVVCDIGNPLPQNKTASFKILLQPFYNWGMTTSYFFDFYVNSTNPENENTIEDNYKNYSISILIDATMELRGESHPLILHYNESFYTSEKIVKESEIGPQVTHVYYLKNKAPAMIEEAEIFLLWPATTLNNEDLLYLLDVHGIGDVKCDAVRENYNNYIVDRPQTSGPLSIWNRLKIDISSIEQDSSVKSSESTNIEIGKGVSSGKGVFNSQESSLDKQISKSSGDSSYVIGSRHNESGLNSYGRIIGNGETIVTESRYRTSYIQGEPRTIWENVTKILDARGNVLKTDKSSNNQEFDAVGNAQDFSTGDYKKIITKSRSYTSNFNGVPYLWWENTTKVLDGNGNLVETWNSKDRSEVSLSSNFGSAYSENAGNGERTIVESKYHTSYFNGVPHSRWENFTKVLDSKGNVLRVHNSNDPHQNQQTSFSHIESQRQGQQDRLRQEEENIQLQQAQAKLAEDRRAEQGQNKRIQYENDIRRQEEEQRWNQRRPDEERRRWEQQRKQQMEIKKQDERQEEQRIIQLNSQQQSNKQNEEERRRSYEALGSDDERRRKEEQQTQHNWRRQKGERRRLENEERAYQVGGGVREGGNSQTDLRQYGSNVYNSGSTGTRVVTRYFDEQGLYHDVPKNPSGGSATFNKTYTVESSASIPIDISGGSQDYGQGQSLDDTASGQGFRVQTLDLGQVGQSSYGQVYGGGYGQSGRGQSGDGNGKYRGEWHSEESFSQSGKIPPTFVHNTIEQKDNVPTEYPNLNNRRGKRQATPTVDPIEEIKALIKCNSSNCVYVRCVARNLNKDKEIAVALRSRLNVRAVKDLVVNQPIKVSSMMVARINKLFPNVTLTQKTLRKQEVFTEVPSKEAELTPEVASLWIYVVSAVAGVLLLLLLIWLLSKCGFFKRNRPSSAPERQPLNRNGYHNGDEAL